MDKFFRYGMKPETIPGYNCSFVGNLSAQWYTEGISKIIIGTGLIIYGLCTQFLYILVMWTMYGLINRNSCYRIMLCLGFFDFVTLAIGCDLTGILWLTRDNFCSKPVLNYIAGSTVLGLWCAVCLSCLILVINRLFDLWDTNLHQKFFGGNATFYWLIFPFLYYFYFDFYTIPVVFNSTFNAWMFSPFIRGTSEEMAEFVNIPHTINNCVVVVITCILYVVLVILWKKKYSSHAHPVSANKFQRSITVQCVSICSASFLASIMYVYMNIFEVPILTIPASHIVWQLSHGIPAFVYLSMNNTIRMEVLRKLRFRSSSGGTASSQQYSATGLSNTRNSVNPSLPEELFRGV